MSYALEPLVAGELGDGTSLDPSVHPPVVHSVEYVLDYPTDEDLIESFPVVLVSEELAARLVEANLQGFELDSATVTESDGYRQLHGDRPHKVYRWLKPAPAESPDAWTGSDYRFCVSDRMMKILRTASHPELRDRATRGRVNGGGPGRARLRRGVGQPAMASNDHGASGRRAGSDHRQQLLLDIDAGVPRTSEGHTASSRG
jgi:hypothetical protein